MLRWGVVTSAALAVLVGAMSPNTASGQRPDGLRVVGVSAPQPSRARRSPSREGRFAIRVGLGGVVLSPGSNGLAGLVEGGYTRSGHRIAIRTLQASTVPLPRTSVFEIGAVYARSVRGDWTRASLGAGLAHVKLCRLPSSSAREECHGEPGLPLVAGVALRVWTLGLGLDGFLTLTPEEAHRGLLLYGELGWPP